jgi:hypothetical protein
MHQRSSGTICDPQRLKWAREMRALTMRIGTSVSEWAAFATIMASFRDDIAQEVGPPYRQPVRIFCVFRCIGFPCLE